MKIYNEINRPENNVVYPKSGTPHKSAFSCSIHDNTSVVHDSTGVVENLQVSDGKGMYLVSFDIHILTFNFDFYKTRWLFKFTKDQSKKPNDLPYTETGNPRRLLTFLNAVNDEDQRRIHGLLLDMYNPIFETMKSKAHEKKLKERKESKMKIERVSTHKINVSNMVADYQGKTKSLSFFIVVDLFDYDLDNTIWSIEIYSETDYICHRMYIDEFLDEIAIPLSDNERDLVIEYVSNLHRDLCEEREQKTEVQDEKEIEKKSDENCNNITIYIDGDVTSYRHRLFDELFNIYLVNNNTEALSLAGDTDIQTPEFTIRIFESSFNPVYNFYITKHNSDSYCTSVANEVGNLDVENIEMMARLIVALENSGGNSACIHAIINAIETKKEFVEEEKMELKKSTKSERIHAKKVEIEKKKSEAENSSIRGLSLLIFTEKNAKDYRDNLFEHLTYSCGKHNGILLNGEYGILTPTFDITVTESFTASLLNLYLCSGGVQSDDFSVLHVAYIDGTIEDMADLIEELECRDGDIRGMQEYINDVVDRENQSKCTEPKRESKFDNYNKWGCTTYNAIPFIEDQLSYNTNITNKRAERFDVYPESMGSVFVIGARKYKKSIKELAQMLVLSNISVNGPIKLDKETFKCINGNEKYNYKADICQKIMRSDMVVIVGDDNTHSDEYIYYTIQEAESRHIPVLYTTDKLAVSRFAENTGR